MGLMAFALLVMAVGVIIGKTKIKGSCRGKGDEYSCDVCAGGEEPCVKKVSPFWAPLRAFSGRGEGTE